MNIDKWPDLRISATPEAAAKECAAYIADVLKARGQAKLAISGGKTPTAMFEELAKADLYWPGIHIFWVDERCVPPTDEQSNFKQANASLLLPARVPQSNIHRIPGELDASEAAQRYIHEITSVFSLAAGELPVFDVLHRGMGPDCHTASLFPGEPLINDRTGIAAHVWVEKMKMHRVTLLPGVLLAAKHTVMQAVGPDKADPLNQVLYGPDDPLKYPCQIATRGSSNAVWFIDTEAAGRRVANA
jgi:6-phosphogluconolactonase